METPLVSFVSPCYNHSKYIIESLESIRAQTYPNIQHIIIDDCSRDDSVYKIQKWIDENGYACEFIRHRSNKGISYTLNESIEKSQGKYWSPLATDDKILPSRTEKFVTYFEADRDALMVVSDCAFIDESSNLIQQKGFESFLSYHTEGAGRDFAIETFGTYRSLLSGNYIPSSIMLAKRAFDEVGLFHRKLSMEDWEMWLRISNRSRIRFINEKLTFYRFHLNNTNNQREMIDINTLKTFLAQYKTCLNNGSSDDYYRIYQKYFLKYFSFRRNFKNSLLFLYHTPLKPFLYNLKIKFKDFTSRAKSISNVG